jgi:hypothetical protein
MRIPWNSADPQERRLRWGWCLKFVFIAVFTVLFFLLAQSMVEHRFFQGGELKSNGVIGQ